MDILARRFTIICLLTALFGMGMANLVARADHGPFQPTFTAACQLSYASCQ